MSDDLATQEQLEELQRLAGIPNLPTQLTYECRKAMSGEGPRAFTWTDKPHRLIFDLCRRIEELEAVNSPYLTETVSTTKRSYNPNYGDDRICVCGHRYYRHFDTYEEMYPCGCKYCDCYTFVEAVDKPE